MFNSRFLCAVYLLIGFDDTVLNMIWIFLATSMFAMQEIAKHFPNFLVHIVSEHTLYWGNTTSNAGTVWSLAAEMTWIVFVRNAKSGNNFAKKFQMLNFWLLTSYCLSFELRVCMNEKDIYLSRMQSTIRMRRDW